ncbi:hypothetical protein DLM75_09790 [Leptospira stimsonii]|uniref:Uncharacterized protein n=1 Tax=Leptospira stimsonii TaxID=2202203 RepID=A0A396ZAQ7_9LEPT|nr:hypothetical protein DLM75_09790 [Leptospira stimsonii]
MRGSEYLHSELNPTGNHSFFRFTHQKEEILLLSSELNAETSFHKDHSKSQTQCENVVHRFSSRFRNLHGSKKR